jgi:HTH-type transcriptional regulator / antitoxin MqsA
MSCVFCGGKLEHKNVTFIYDEDNHYILVENVPAEVCEKCGEKIFAPKVTEELLKFAREKTKPSKTIQVPVFEYLEKG